MNSNRIFWKNKGLTDKKEIQTIIKSYEEHPSIRQIKDVRNLCCSEIEKITFLLILQ